MHHKTNGFIGAGFNWMVYRLPENPSRELAANLACLQDCASDDPVLRRDAERLRKMRARLEKTGCPCAVRQC
jgi:ArsR family transcriptional regulator